MIIFKAFRLQSLKFHLFFLFFMYFILFIFFTLFTFFDSIFRFLCQKIKKTNFINISMLQSCICNVLTLKNSFISCFPLKLQYANANMFYILKNLIIKSLQFQFIDKS